MKKKEQEEILNRARKRRKEISEAEYEMKADFREDIEFTYNINDGQWNAADAENRRNAGRPYLSMNKLHKFASQVVNAEKGVPNLDDIIPVDDQGDIEVAKIYNELIEYIEYQSQAEDVYCGAAKHAVAGGFGYWRILTAYADDSFDQELYLRAIKNPLNVSLDPRGNYAFIWEVVPEEEFKEIVKIVLKK